MTEDTPPPPPPTYLGTILVELPLLDLCDDFVLQRHLGQSPPVLQALLPDPEPFPVSWHVQLALEELHVPQDFKLQ